jgi:hypothetical protein
MARLDLPDPQTPTELDVAALRARLVATLAGLDPVPTPVDDAALARIVSAIRDGLALCRALEKQASLEELREGYLLLGKAYLAAQSEENARRCRMRAASLGAR